MRCTIYLIVGLIYSLILTFFGLVATGMGHGIGTSVFWMLSLLPVPIIFWPIVGLLLCRAQIKSIRIAIACLIVIHYISFGVYVFTLTPQNYQDFLTVWHYQLYGCITNVLAYLTGQILIWQKIIFVKNQTLV